MLTRGMLKEILEFHQRIRALPAEKIQHLLYNKDQNTVPHMKDYDFSAGIFQAIGFKEFATYIDSLNISENDSADAQIFPENALYHRSVEDMKAATRRYAKKQIAWVKNRVLPGNLLVIPDRSVNTCRIRGVGLVFQLSDCIIGCVALAAPEAPRRGCNSRHSATRIPLSLSIVCYFPFI